MFYMIKNAPSEINILIKQYEEAKKTSNKDCIIKLFFTITSKAISDYPEWFSSSIKRFQIEAKEISLLYSLSENAEFLCITKLLERIAADMKLTPTKITIRPNNNPFEWSEYALTRKERKDLDEKSKNFTEYNLDQYSVGDKYFFIAVLSGNYNIAKKLRSYFSSNVINNYRAPTGKNLLQVILNLENFNINHNKIIYFLLKKGEDPNHFCLDDYIIASSKHFNKATIQYLALFLAAGVKVGQKLDEKKSNRNKILPSIIRQLRSLGKGIEDLEKYQAELLKKGKKEEEKIVGFIAGQLRKKIPLLIANSSPENIQEFSDLLHSEDSVLNKTPTWEVARNNILLAIATLGVGYLFAGLCHLAATNGKYFLFFKPQEKIEGAVKNIENIFQQAAYLN